MRKVVKWAGTLFPHALRMEEHHSRLQSGRKCTTAYCERLSLPPYCHLEMRCSETASKMSQGLPAVFQGEVGHTCLYRIKLMCPPLNDILCQKGETPGPFPTLPPQLLSCLLQAFLLCLLPFLTAMVGLLFQLRNVRQMNIKITCGMGQHEQSVHYLNNDNIREHFEIHV